MYKEKVRILELTSDPIFKAFMMSEDTREYTAKLINLITGIPRDEILKHSIFNNVEIPVRNKKDKRYRTDIIITVLNNIINIEMNREYYDGLLSKNDSYKSRIYGDQFDVGDNYIEAKKIISINIDEFSHFKSKKFLYKFVTMEESTHEVLEDNSETYHLDLEYLRKKWYNKEELIEIEKLCLIFIERDEKKLESLKKGDMVMERAVERLELISQDEKLIGLYDADAVERKVWKTKLMYAEKLGTERGMKKGIKAGIEKGIKQGLKQGIEQGIERGIERGTKDGIKEGKIEVAKNMLANGMDKIDILKMTGLNDKEFENLLSK